VSCADNALIVNKVN